MRKTVHTLIGILLFAVAVTYWLLPSPMTEPPAPVQKTPLEPKPLAKETAVPAAPSIPRQPFEPGASLGYDFGNMEPEAAAKIIAAAVRLVRATGYRCDTISYVGMRQLLFQGVALSCNANRYSYRIKDVGGTWVVEAR